MRDSLILAFSRLRRSEQTEELHLLAGDPERADLAYDDVMADGETFDNTSPTDSEGVMIKGGQAIASLESSDYDEPAKALRLFFKTRRTIDGAWLRDLRSHIEALKALELRTDNYDGIEITPGVDYAITCLESILAGMSKPRLA